MPEHPRMISGGSELRHCGTLRGVTTDPNQTSTRARARTGLIVGIGAAVLVAVTVAVTLAATRQKHPEPAAQQQTATTAAAAAATSAAPTPTPTYCINDSRLPSGACAIDPTKAAPALGDDRVAWAVCPAILRASTADMASPDKMEPLGDQAATSQDTGLATSGQLLADRARLARAAKGKSNEASIIKDMASSAADIATKCRNAGFKA